METAMGFDWWRDLDLIERIDESHVWVHDENAHALKDRLLQECSEVLRELLKHSADAPPWLDGLLTKLGYPAETREVQKYFLGVRTDHP